MSIYHLSVKTVSRSAGRTATAAAAYRAADLVSCERLGICHDYTRKRGVEHSEIMVPNGVPMLSRNDLWNMAEKAENRKNSTVAREFEYAIPHELDAKQRVALVRQISREIVERHKCALDFSMHRPHEKESLNYHAHILMTTRRLTKDGLGEKTRELDDKKSGEVEYWRERIATITNEHLARAKVDARVDHRSHKDRGLTDIPTSHLGPAVSQIVQRGGDSHVVDRIKEQSDDAIKKAQRQARESAEMSEMITNIIAHIDTSQRELDALKAEQKLDDLKKTALDLTDKVSALKQQESDALKEWHAAQHDVNLVRDKQRVAGQSIFATIKYSLTGGIKELKAADQRAEDTGKKWQSLDNELKKAKSDLASVQAQIPAPPPPVTPPPLTQEQQKAKAHDAFVERNAQRVQAAIEKNRAEGRTVSPYSTQVNIEKLRRSQELMEQRFAQQEAEKDKPKSKG